MKLGDYLGSYSVSPPPDTPDWPRCHDCKTAPAAHFIRNPDGHYDLTCEACAQWPSWAKREPRRKTAYALGPCSDSLAAVKGPRT